MRNTGDGRRRKDVEMVTGECGNVDNLVVMEAACYLSRYNDRYIMVIFPNLRTERKDVKIRGGKYHLSGIGRLGKNSQFSSVNQK
jgi:hypothetical protein